MILYLETSRLVKLYFAEDGSAETRALVEKADAVAVSIVAYAEARAAFARKRGEQEIEATVFKRLRDDFDRDWGSMFVIALTETIIRAAGDLAETHGLGGFDAIHLASAMALRARADGKRGKPASDSPVIVFCTADQKLGAAARAEGL